MLDVLYFLTGSQSRTAITKANKKQDGGNGKNSLNGKTISKPLELSLPTREIDHYRSGALLLMLLHLNQVGLIFFVETQLILSLRCKQIFCDVIPFETILQQTGYLLGTG